jgi:outer membrane lipoprotein carrier protein
VIVLALAAVLVISPAIGGDAPAVSAAQSSPDLNVPDLTDEARVQAILAEFDRAQASIRTLAARFSERKDLALLVEPILSKGEFFYASPNRARWQYTEPDDRIFLISDNTLQQYFPGRKVLEKRDLSAANTTRVFRLFGMGQTSTELSKMYEITLGETEAGSQAYLLILKPRRHMVEKRLSQVKLWVGEKDFLPRAMQWEEADGDTTLLSFENVNINSTIAEDKFQLEVPDDVEVKKQITLFSTKGSSP